MALSLSLVGVLAAADCFAQSQFAGVYTGTFSGDDQGTFVVTIQDDGSLSGSGTGQDGPFGISGSVNPSGDVDFLAGNVTDGSTFMGTITAGGSLSGTWDNTFFEESGTFSGNIVTAASGSDDPSAVAVVDSQARTAIDSINVQRGNFYRRLENLRAGAQGLSLEGATVSFGDVTVSPDVFTTGAAGLRKLRSQLAIAQNAARDRYGPGRGDGVPEASEAAYPRDLLPASTTAQAGDEFALPQRWGVFINGNVILGERDETGSQSGFDFTTAGISAGIDYRFSPNFIAGIGGGFAHSDTDISGGGNSDSDAYYGVFYATGSLGENAYVDVVSSVGKIDFDIERETATSATANGDTDALQFWSGITGGYNFPIDALTFGTYVRVNGGITRIDGFTESGAGAENLRFDDDDIASFSTVIGLRAEYVISTSVAVIVPYLRAEYEHEFADTPTNDVRFANDPTGTSFNISSEDIDRDFFNLGGGASVVLPQAWSAFVDYDGLVGAEDLTRHSITLGIRKEF